MHRDNALRTPVWPALLVGALSGAAAGWLATAALGPPDRDVTSDGGQPSGVALDEAALGRAIAGAHAPLREEIGRLSETIASVRASGRSSPEPIAAPTAPDPVAPRPAEQALWVLPPTPATMEMRPAGLELTPPANLARLRAVLDFGDNPLTRQRYLFMPARDALMWFGTPDGVDTDGATERWQFEVPAAEHEDGEVITQAFDLAFHDGYLVEAAGEEWEWE